MVNKVWISKKEAEFRLYDARGMVFKQSRKPKADLKSETANVMSRLKKETKSSREYGGKPLSNPDPSKTIVSKPNYANLPQDLKKIAYNEVEYYSTSFLNTRERQMHGSF